MAAGLTGAGALYGGVAEYEAGSQRRTLFNTNADIADQQALSEVKAGAYNENSVRMRGAQMTGQQIAATGANNLQQAGTPAQVIASTAGINERDALETRNNALRRAWGFRVQGASDRAQADFAQNAGEMDAVGTILGGGARAYRQYKDTGESWFG
jgi:hypothetical protein